MKFSLGGKRVIVAAAMIVAAGLALAGCSTGKSTSAEGGAWSFKDDLGKTVSLSHTPTRIAGLNDVIVSLMEYGIKPVASFGYSSIQADQRFDGLNTKGITQVGTTYGEINLEKLAEAKPDLIVANVYPTDSKGTIDKSQPDYGFKNKNQEKEVAKIAPIVTIYMGGDGTKVVSSTTKLALALGAKKSRVSADEKRYDSARSALGAAAKKNKVEVTMMYADSDGVYVAKPEDDPALRMYKEAGVNLFTPTPKGYYWGIYSWENAPKVKGDMILLQQTGYTVADLKKQATFADNPALASGQIHTYVSSGMDYVQQAAYMNKLAGWIRAAKVVSD